MQEIIVVEKPNSSFSEAIKTVRTNIKFSSVDKKIKTIMVTSSVPGEGKSFVSSNLAAAFSQFNEKVLLIDCDLRKGRQHKIFDIENDKRYGLSNLLMNENLASVVKKYIVPTSIKNLSLLPTGIFPSNPSELLASEKMRSLVEILKIYYDVIIFDCPPLTGLNDALIVSSYADASIIVAKHKSTPLELLEKSKKSLEAVNANIAGVILNQINAKHSSSYYYNNSYYTE